MPAKNHSVFLVGAENICLIYPEAPSIVPFWKSRFVVASWSKKAPSVVSIGVNMVYTQTSSSHTGHELCRESGESLRREDNTQDIR